MKKHIAFILTTALTVLLASCGDTSAVDSMIAKQEESGSSQAAVSPIDESTPSPDDIAEDYWQGKETSPVPDQVDLNELDTSNGDVDVDLTVLDSNIVYAQVFDMLTYPENYIGKTVVIIPKLGYILIFLHSKKGKIAAITLIVLLLILSFIPKKDTPLESESAGQEGGDNGTSKKE